MKIYIILAHANPRQLERLINRLNDGDSEFYIHLDLNSKIEDFISIRKDNVTFIKNRIECRWGDISLVDATINLLKEIVNVDFKHVILLSGQDYPIKSNQYINDFLDENINYISSNEMNVCWADEHVNMRKSWYKIKTTGNKRYCIAVPSVLSFDFFSKMALENYIKLFVAACKNMVSIHDVFPMLLKKRQLLNIDYYGGSQWFAFNKKTVNKILSYLEDHPEYHCYYKYMFVPDEVFFQTLIRIVNSEIKDTVTYVNWSRKDCKLPVEFNTFDLNELLSCGDGYLFARKFEDNHDDNILDLLDKENGWNSYARDY